jgi:hypothetical protein
MDEEELATLPVMSLEELARHTGIAPSTSIFVGAAGRVFDVTTGKAFYGPSGAYANAMIILGF